MRFHTYALVTGRMEHVVKKSTDTIPAKLTPREAVLNRNAAELLGRDTIKRLNDHGNMLSKRGVDLAGLQSDPAPYPASENLAGLQMGTADVGRDDRGDLLKDAENTFYGGGTAPMPTPTPTPTARGYAHGTSSVFDPKKRRNAASRLSYGSLGGPVGSTAFGAMINTAQQTQPVPTSTYNPAASTSNLNIPSQQRPMSHTDMAVDIARRNLTTTGSALGIPQQPSGPPTSRMPFINGGYQFPAGSVLPSGFREDGGGGLTQGSQTEARYSSSPFVNGGYIFPTGSVLPEGFQEDGGGGLTRQVSGSDPYGYVAMARSQSGGKTPNWTPEEWKQATGGGPQSDVHFLPPGFTATTGSSGTPNSSPNDIHFLPPGFTSVQGVTNPQTKQLQQDQGYGSAYGY